MGKLVRTSVWGATGLFALVFLTQPIGIDGQLALAVSAIVAMTITWRCGRGRYARWLFLSLGSLVVIRYIVWRITSTLPSLPSPFSVLCVGLSVYGGGGARLKCSFMHLYM